MARPVGGMAFVEKAREAIAEARSVEALRQAQAVLLPLALGLDMKQTGTLIGTSARWACTLRTRFLQGTLAGKRARSHRPRQNMSGDEEKAFLAPFFDVASSGGILVVSGIHRALEEKLGRKVALSSIYHLLHRHGWRKLAPDKHHPDRDPLAQEAWKKNSPTPWPSSSKAGQAPRKSP